MIEQSVNNKNNNNGIMDFVEIRICSDALLILSLPPSAVHFLSLSQFESHGGCLPA